MLRPIFVSLLLAAPAGAYQFPKAESAAPEAAPPGEPWTRRAEAELWTCFNRPPHSPRVDRHLPKLVCVAGVSVALVIQSDGQPLFQGGMLRAGTPHASRALVAGGIDARRIPPEGQALFGLPHNGGWRVWTVVERSPEDPGGDSSAVTLEFAVDAAGKPLPGTLKVYGEVACTAPSCQGALATERVDFIAEPPGSRKQDARRSAPSQPRNG
jgi:hypothetical protein